MNVKVNFNDAKEQENGFTQIEKGTYAVTVNSVVIKSSKNSGNKYLNWEFVITDKSKFKNRHLFAVTTLHPNSLWHLQSLLEAVDYEHDGSVNINTDDLTGRQCKVVVGEEQYEGQTRPKIVGYIKDKTVTNVEEEIPF